MGVPTFPPGEFEEGFLTFPGVAEAGRDSMYADTGYIADDLSDQAPWRLSLLYNDGGAISIPLELMFYEPLKGATITIFRRHKQSGRIIPCQISQDDPTLRDSSLAGLPWQEVIRRVVPPRFDPVLTPSIINTLNLDQMVSMSLGILNVLKLQLMNPVMFGWAPAAEADTAGSAALRILSRRAAVAASGDAAAISARLFSEVSALPVNRFLQFLEGARRLSVLAVPPQVKADAIELLAQRLGLEIGGRAVVQGGRILIVAKDAKTALQIATDGSVSFGRVKITGGIIDIVDPAPIRALKP